MREGAGVEPGRIPAVGNGHIMGFRTADPSGNPFFPPDRDGDDMLHDLLRNGGKVDRIGDDPLDKVIGDLPGNHLGDLVLGLAGAGAQVRRENDVGVFKIWPETVQVVLSAVRPAPPRSHDRFQAPGRDRPG